MPTVDRHIAKLDVEMVAGQGRGVTFVDLLATTSTSIGSWTAVANGTALAVSASGNDVVVTWSDALATSTIGRTWRLRLSGDDKIGGRVVEARPQTTPGPDTVTVTLTDPAEVTVTVAGVAVGAVDSVNGETGVVSLSAADVGADPSGTAATAVAAHAVATDPHGDRAHAAGLVDDLSGVSNATTARANLGLGSAALAATGDFDAAGTAAARTLVGTLASRPSAAALANGVRYLATDDSGGTLWVVSSGAWVQAAPPVGAPMSLLALAKLAATETINVAATSTDR